MPIGTRQNLKEDNPRDAPHLGTPSHSLQMNGPEEPSGRRPKESVKTDTRQNMSKWRQESRIGDTSVLLQ